MRYLDGIRVEEFRGLAGLAEIESEWRWLLDRVEQPRYFQDFDWFREYCRHGFQDHSRLLFLSVRNPDGDPLAIFPLELRTERIRRVPLLIWALIGSRENDVLITASSADILCPESDLCATALEAAIQHLKIMRPRAALLLFGRMARTSMAAKSCDLAAVSTSATYEKGGFGLLSTTSGPDDFETRLSHDFRRKLRSRTRRLEVLGTTRFEIVKKNDRGFPAAYQLFLKVESSGWKGKRGSCTALRFLHQQRAFIEEVQKGGSEVCPQVHLLWLGGKCIAADYFWRYRNTLIRIKISYDEAYRKMGLGHLMLLHAVRHACGDNGVDYIDRVTAPASLKDWGQEQMQQWHWQYIGLGGVRGGLGAALLRLPSRKEVFSNFGRRLEC